MYGKYLRRIKIEPMAFNLFKCGVPSGVHEPHGIQRNFCDESVIRNHHGYCTKENLKRKLVMVLYHNHIMPRIRTDPTPPSITSPHLTPLHLPYPTSPHHSPTWPHSSHLTSPHPIPPFQYPTLIYGILATHLQVIWQFLSSCISRIHGDEHSTSWV